MAGFLEVENIRLKLFLYLFFFFSGSGLTCDDVSNISVFALMFCQGQPEQNSNNRK